jgi:uncharacterized protein
MYDGPTMTKTIRLPILGVFAAIAITSTMDATGLSTFSALPLFPLLGLCWYLQRLSRGELGFKWGQWRHYGLAALYPVSVVGAITIVAAATGVIDLSHTNWRKAGINLILVTISTVLVVIVTEEGFFRGWLWVSLERAGLQKASILLWSSIAFSLWHWSAVMLKTGFDPPRAQVPVFMVNAVVMGAVWALLRWISGSVIVSSVSHGLWNGMAYVFFGFGTKVGALGIKNTGLFGPEVGVLGLAANLIFAAALWRWWKSGLSSRSLYTLEPRI